MIASLEGTLRRRDPSGVVIECGGVGYLVHVPTVTFGELPQEGERAELEVVTLFRNESLSLYGFSSLEERALFSVLIEISGIGPRLALAILSTMSIEAISAAVESEESAPFEAVPGIGRKGAKRITLELKGRLDPELLRRASARLAGSGAPAVTLAEPVDQATREDLIATLEGLGFRRGEVAEIVDEVLTELDEEQDIALKLRAVLRRLDSR